MSPAKGTATTKPCTQCGAQMRPFGARKEDWPGTKARSTGLLCSSCWARIHRPSRNAPVPAPGWKPSAASDEPCVLVRADLRPSTYKRIAEAARARGIAPAEMLSRIADAVVQGEKP